MFAQVTAKNVGGVFWHTVYIQRRIKDDGGIYPPAALCLRVCHFIPFSLLLSFNAGLGFSNIPGAYPGLPFVTPTHVHPHPAFRVRQ